MVRCDLARTLPCASPLSNRRTSPSRNDIARQDRAHAADESAPHQTGAAAICFQAVFVCRRECRRVRGQSDGRAIQRDRCICASVCTTDAKTPGAQSRFDLAAQQRDRKSRGVGPLAMECRERIDHARTQGCARRRLQISGSFPAIRQSRRSRQPPKQHRWPQQRGRARTPPHRDNAEPLQADPQRPLHNPRWRACRVAPGARAYAACAPARAGRETGPPPIVRCAVVSRRTKRSPAAAAIGRSSTSCTRPSPPGAIGAPPAARCARHIGCGMVQPHRHPVAERLRFAGEQRAARVDAVRRCMQHRIEHHVAALYRVLGRCPRRRD